jgi:hypothetical protein
MEEMNGELLPDHEPEHTCSDAERHRVEEQHADDRHRRVAVAAQIGDEAPTLGDGEQHRVEREQEPYEGADDREKRRRLVARGRSLGKLSFVIARGLDVQTPAGQTHERLVNLTFHAGGRLDQDARDTCVQACHSLREE